MGVISGPKITEETGPECPPMLVPVFEKYRELKFIQRETDDNLILISRDMLTWQEIAAYKALSLRKISILDVELINGLDAIFEGRDNG